MKKFLNVLGAILLGMGIYCLVMEFNYEIPLFPIVLGGMASCFILTEMGVDPPVENENDVITSCVIIIALLVIGLWKKVAGIINILSPETIYNDRGGYIMLFPICLIAITLLVIARR